MKTKLILGSATLSLALAQPIRAQFSGTAPGGSSAQYLNADATMSRAYLTGEHLVFNSQHGAIDWGGSGTGDLFFRTLSTQGNIFTYTNRMILNNSGDLGLGTASPADRLHVVATGNNGITITQPSAGGAVLTLENNLSGGGTYAVTSTGPGAGSPGAGHFVVYDVNAGAERLFIEGSTGNVGINKTNPGARLHSFTNDGTGLRGDAWYNSGTSVTGVVGNGSNNNGTNTGVIYGTAGHASGGATNHSGYFLGSGGPVGVTSYGVYAGVNNNNAGGTNYGIYATVFGNANSGNGPNWAGWFDGDVETTSAAYYSSDKRLKKDIMPIANSLNIINKLNPVNYTFDVESNPDINLPSVKQYGFISQEIQEIMPELTKLAIHPAKLDETGKEIYPSKEILSLNYNGFIAILAKGIQEQQQIIEAQNRKIDALQEQVNALSNDKSGNATGINTQPAVSDFALDQNIPNPFSNETIVKYSLPQTTGTAFMAVYDLTGKQISTFPVNERGTSSITLTSENLPAGIYIYSIVADGKVMDSKRMIVADK